MLQPYNPQPPEEIPDDAPVHKPNPSKKPRSDNRALEDEAETPSPLDIGVDPGYSPHEGDIASGVKVPPDICPPKTRAPGGPPPNSKP